MPLHNVTFYWKTINLQVLVDSIIATCQIIPPTLVIRPKQMLVHLLQMESVLTGNRLRNSHHEKDAAGGQATRVRIRSEDVVSCRDKREVPGWNRN